MSGNEYGRDFRRLPFFKVGTIIAIVTATVVYCSQRLHMSSDVLVQIEQLLQAQQIAYDMLHHPPVKTSAEAAAVRGVPLASGAKALICKCDQEMVMFVMPADRRLAGKSIRRQAGYKKLRFASEEEVWELTGLKPGSIPPFGSLFDITTICDPALGKNTQINFNAGEHSISISMGYNDYVAAESPRMLKCSETTE